MCTLVIVEAISEAEVLWTNLQLVATTPKHNSVHRNTKGAVHRHHRYQEGRHSATR